MQKGYKLGQGLQIGAEQSLKKLGKITHIWRRCGKLQNFFLEFIDELEKQITIKETVELGQLKTK